MLLSILLFVVTDMIWLVTAGKYALTMHEKIQGVPVVFRYGAAAIVYVALAYLLTYAKSALNAFYIGLSAYAVYDFTNYALLKNYDIRFALADTIWGGILFSAVFMEKVYLERYI
jgi:uncharacterized membrane protein